MAFIRFLLFFVFSIFFLQLHADRGDTIRGKIDVDANTQFFSHLDSLTKLYYVNQSLKMQRIDPDACCTGDNPYFPDSVIAARLESIVSVIDLPFNYTVRSFIDAYTGRKRAFMQVMIGLSEYYFPMFEEVFDLYGLPEELKYLAIIESALNPRAVSTAGATGIWQFMYATGKIYGMEVNSFVDDRRDPLKATYAAAEYLTELYALYGDWALAMAAYNCGPGNMNKAIRRSKGKTNFWELHSYLPRETRSYVPLFIAATYLMNFYKEHNLVPVKVEMPLITDTIMIHQELSMQLVADFLELPIEQLQDLNPQYKRDIIPANNKAYALRLPAEYACKFIDLQDSIYNWRDTNHVELIAPLIVSVKTVQETPYVAPENNVALNYTVKAGDNLGYISSWYNVSITNLRIWNNLQGNLIRPGQRLTVYVSASKADHYRRINEMSFAQKQESAGKTTSGSQSSDYIIYTVKSGDSPWSIARKYPGVSEQEIIKLNNIANARGIQPGDKLKIPRK